MNISAAELSTTSDSQLVFDLSETQSPSGRAWGRDVSLPTGERSGKGTMPPPKKMLDIFHYKILHSGAYSHTNSKVLFAINAGKSTSSRYFLAIDTDTKTSSFH